MHSETFVRITNDNEETGIAKETCITASLWHQNRHPKFLQNTLDNVYLQVAIVCSVSK